MSDFKKEIMTKQQDFGQTVLNDINRLKDSELKVLIAELLCDSLGELERKYQEILYSDNVTRMIKNGNCKEINFSYYSQIMIDWSGIMYKPEHGQAVVILKWFSLYPIFSLKEQD